MRYLFVMAHPDDEADVGGSIYELGKQGHKIAVAIIVGKVAARRNLSDSLSADERKSMNILGVNKVYHADFPNIMTNTVPHLDIVQFIESCITDWNANAIVTHHSADVNIDHAVASTATVAACRLFQRATDIPQLRLLLFCEAAGATEWSLDKSKNRFMPNYFVKIGIEGVEKKIQAHHSYSGVPRPYPHPYSPETYKGLAAYRGAQAGVNYAEAFQCVFRSV